MNRSRIVDVLPLAVALVAVVLLVVFWPSSFA
jgi:hypothetical protein